MKKILSVAYQEIAAFQIRWLLAKLLTFFLPHYVGGRWRAVVLRLVGFQIGNGTWLAGMPIITGPKEMHKRLVMGEEVWLNFGCVFDLGSSITVGSRVYFGHEVLLLTTTHEISTANQRAGRHITKPIVIEDGVWLGARSTILPGVRVGQGAVVGAGAVVTKDVAPNTVVGGVPAKTIRDLPPDSNISANDLLLPDNGQIHEDSISKFA